MDEKRLKRMRRSTTELEKCVELLGKDYIPAMGCNGIYQVSGHLKNILAENTRLRKALENTRKCNTKDCDEVISTSYCAKCRRDWES